MAGTYLDWKDQDHTIAFLAAAIITCNDGSPGPLEAADH